MFVAVLTDNGTVHVNINHIIKVEKSGNGVKIFLSDTSTIMTSFTLDSTMNQIANARKAS